jgi:hypothetical protein
MRSCVESCADEIADLVPPWTDQQRHDVERCLCIHLLSMHGRGMREVSRLLLLDEALTMETRRRLADAVEAALLARREFTTP